MVPVGFRAGLATIAAAAVAALCPRIATAAEGAVPPDAPPFQWVSIGPTQIAPTGASYDVVPSTGRVSSLSLFSTGVLAATANGGIWRRNATSGAWTALTDTQRDLAFGAVAVAPSNSDVIYAGTGEDHDCLDCGDGEDLYKSIDGGTTWSKVTSLPGVGPGRNRERSPTARGAAVRGSTRFITSISLSED